MKCTFGKWFASVALTVFAACSPESNSGGDAQKFSQEQVVTISETTDLSESCALSQGTRERLQTLTPGISYDPPAGVLARPCSKAVEIAFVRFMSAASLKKRESIAAACYAMLVSDGSQTEVRKIPEGTTKEMAQQRVNAYNASQALSGAPPRVACLIEFV